MDAPTAVNWLIIIDAILVIAAFGYLFYSQRKIRSLHEDCQKDLNDKLNLNPQENNIHRIAIGQMQTVTKINELVLAQAQKSFTFALFYSIGGILFFFTFLLIRQPQDAPTISAIGSTVLELIAGVHLYLYGRATNLMVESGARLFKVEDFLLAVNVCELHAKSKSEETCAKIALIIANYSDNPNAISHEGKNDERVGGLSSNGSHPQVELNNVAI